MLLALTAVVIPGSGSTDGDGYALVPGGQLRHRSCCHLVPDGAIVEQHADGSASVRSPGSLAARHIPPCAHAAKPAARLAGDGYIANGYVMDAYVPVLPDEGVGSFSGKFDVPTLPRSGVGSDTTVFLWIGTEGDKGYNVLQPVIQIGPSAAGDAPSNWRLASWYVGPDHSFFSALRDVKEQETVMGAIVRDAGSDKWTVMGSTPSVAATSVQVAGSITGNQNYTLYAAMEAYKIKSCDQYPWQYGTPFFDMAATIASGEPFTPGWLPNPITTSCNETVTVHSSSFVDLNWNPQL